MVEKSKSLSVSVGRLFAWFSSCIVGITAILYGAGFLVVHSHLNLLGVSSTSMPVVEYLKEGGRFVLINLIMIYVDKSILILVISVIVLTAAVRFIGTMEVSSLANLAWPANGMLAVWVGKIFPEHLRKTFAWCCQWAIAAAILVSISVLLAKLPTFFVAAQINDLLLRTQSPKLEGPESILKDFKTKELPFDFTTPKGTITDDVMSEIRSNDDEALNSRYQNLLFLFLCMLTLLWLIYLIFPKSSLHGRSLSKSLREAVFRMVLFSAGAISFLQLFLLPLNFGKLVVPNEFPVVVLTVDDEKLAKEFPPDRTFMMLVKNDQEIVLYDPHNAIWQSIMTLKRDHASSIRVIGTDKLF